MINKPTLTESMSQLRQKLHDIEQGNVNEGAGRAAIDAATDAVKAGWKKLTGKAAEEALLKELGEKVTITNEKGQVQTWILQHDDKGIKYHLEGGDARISPEDMKTLKAAEPRKEPSIPPEVTEPHPTLLGPDGKPLQVPAKPKPAITDPVVKAIADVPISTDVPEIVNMGSLYQYFQELTPEELKKLAQNPTANKGFWNAATGKAKSNKGKDITIAALLLLLYFWASPDKTKEKDSTANTGGKTGEAGSAPIGTVIPADEVPWKWVVTGANDSSMIDSMKNAREAYGQVKSQSVTKNESGKWQTTNGQTLNNDKGPTSARLEQLAKMDPEKRKEMTKAENTLTANSVEVYGRDDLPIVPKVNAAEPDINIPDATVEKPDIVIGKDDTEKKKKKKDPKVLPTINW